MTNPHRRHLAHALACLLAGAAIGPLPACSKAPRGQPVPAGDTSAQALERLPDLLAQHSPQLVLVRIGGNDLLRQFVRPRVAPGLVAASTGT